MGAPKNTTSTGQPAKYSDDVGTLFVGTLIALDGTLNVTGGIKATGVLTSVGLEVNIDGAAGTNRDLEWTTTPLSDRWIARANSTAEGGADAGSDLELIAFKDDGVTIIDRPLTVQRAAGNAVIVNRPLTVTNATTTLEKDTASGISVNTDLRNLGAFNAANAVRTTWTFNNSTPATTIFADQTVTTTTPTAGTEAAAWTLRLMVAGVLTTTLSVSGAGNVSVPAGLFSQQGSSNGSYAGNFRNDSATNGFGLQVIISADTAAGTPALSVGSLAANWFRVFADGHLAIGTAVGQLVPGVTSFSFRNNANNVDNLIITDAGAVTIRSTLTASSNLTVSAGTITFNLGGGTGVVTAGAADSAGAGFRLLRVPN